MAKKARHIIAGLVLSVSFILLSSANVFAQDAKPTTKTETKSQALNEALARIDRLEAQIVEMQSVIGALQTMVRERGNRVQQDTFNTQPLQQKFNNQERVGQRRDRVKLDNNGWGADTNSERRGEDQALSDQGLNELAATRIPPADLPLDTRPPESRVTLNGQNPRSLYDAGYNYMMASDYKSAEATFRAFLSNYPNDELSGNAQYWLGEVYFVRGDFRRAANEFLKGYKTYRTSQKAPDNLLKLGMSLQRLGQSEAACQTYSELRSKYRSLPGHIERRVGAEMGKAGC